MILNNGSWFTLVLVQIGGAICLPMLIIGFLLGKSLPLSEALLAIFVGNSLLALLACYMSIIAIRTRKTTPELAVATFGSKIGFSFSLVFMLNLVGWFAIHLVGMAELVAARYLVDYPLLNISVIIVFGALITSSVLGGLRYLEITARYSLPFLLWGMLSLTNIENYVVSWQKSQSFALDFSASILVFSGLFACVVDLPTYYCRAKSIKDGIIASLLLFLVVVPFIEILGLGISSPNGADNFALEVMGTSYGWMRDLFLVFSLLAGWTTNSCNLFSAQTFLKSIAPSSLRLNSKSRIICMGTLGTFLALVCLKISFQSLLLYITSPLLICGALLMLLNARRLS